MAGGDMPGNERRRAGTTMPRPYRIVGRRSERPGELRLRLTAADHGTPRLFDPAGASVSSVPRALPGQFWVLHTRTGAKVPVIDITPNPLGAAGDASVVEVATLRVPCGPPLGVLGDQVGMLGPLGTGWELELADRDIVVIAWEAGLTLVRPVIEHAISGGGRRGRIHVWAVGRSRQAIPYAGGNGQWSAPPGVEVSVAEMPAMAEIIRDVRFDPGGSVALLAGPQTMARSTAAALVARGLPASRIQLAAHSLLQCGSGHCGRCQINSPRGPLRACQDGPVLRYDQLTSSRPSLNGAGG